MRTPNLPHDAPSPKLFGKNDTLVAAGDALNVGLYTQWRNPQALGPHVVGIFVLFATGWWLWSRTADVGNSREVNNKR